jgi:antitoxin component YwqK of YwqJK toxin-antitoxin module
MGQLGYRCNLVDGKRTGLEELWYNDGELESHINYIDGNRTGLVEGWYENGQSY